MTPQGPGGTPAPEVTVVVSTAAAIVAALDQAIANNLTAGGPQKWNINGTMTMLWDVDQMISLRKYYAGLAASESAGGPLSLGGLSQRP